MKPPAPSPSEPGGSSGNSDGDISELDTVDGFLKAVARVSDRPLPVSIDGDSPDLDDEGGSLGTAVERVERERYEVGVEVGRGGMGRVVLAEDRRLGRRVAIKELLRQGRAEQVRFLREALITARLQHPAIVPVHEAGLWPSGEPFYAMKMVSGRPLSALIDEARTPTARLALLPIVITVADAIAYAHSQRVIHRDLKPSNVIVGEFGETVVIDWGLAKPLGDAASPKPRPLEALGAGADTGAGALVGTPGFMSPEQVRGQPADERSDVFSLGALLYCVLAGRAPYRGRDLNEVFRLTLAGPPPPLPVTVPRDLVTIVGQALKPRPDERYPDAQTMAADLRRFSTGQLVRAHRYSAGERLTRFVRRHQALLATVGLALVSLLVVGIVTVRQIVRERDRANAERTSALLRLDQLVLSQAEARVNDDPTLAAAWLNRLSPQSQLWRSARAVAAQILERGVAFDGARGRVAAFSPDGMHLASVDGEGRVRLYEWRPGVGPAQELPGRVGRGRGVLFSPDGTRLAAYGEAGVRLYATAARQSIPLLHDVGAAHGAAFLDSVDGPYGNALVVGAEGGGLHIWSSDGHVLPAPASSADVSQVAVARNLLAWRDGRGAWLWASDRPDPPRSIPTRTAEGAIALSATDLALVDGDTVRVVAVSDGRSRSWPLDRVVALALGPSLLACADSGMVARIDLASGRLVQLSHDGEACRTAAISRGGRLAATRGPMTRMWNESDRVRKLRTDAQNVQSLVFSPDGHWLATATEDDVLRLWRVDDDRNPMAPPHARVTALGAEGDARALITALDTGVSLFDGQWHALGQFGAVHNLVWQDALVGIIGDQGVALVDRTGGLKLRIEPSGQSGQELSPAAMAISRDGGYLALVERTGVVQTRAIDGDRTGPPRTVGLLPDAETIALSPDGALTAVAQRGGRTVSIYAGALIEQRFDIDATISALTFVDEDLLVIGAVDGAVTLAQLSTKQTWPLVVADKSAVVSLVATDTSLRFLHADGEIGERHGLPPGDPVALRRWLSKLSRARLGAHDELRFGD